MLYQTNSSSHANSNTYFGYNYHNIQTEIASKYSFW